MRKTIILIASILMAFNLVGCSNSDNNSNSSTNIEESTTVNTTTEVETTESNEETTTADSTEAVESSEETTSNTATSEYVLPEILDSDIINSETSDVDISNTILPSDTSKKNGAEVGQWVKTTMYSGEDETYHTIYIRINKTTTATEDQDYVNHALALNNYIVPEYAQIIPSEMNIPNSAEIAVLDYDVYIPDEFPASKYGTIIRPRVKFQVWDTGEEGIPSLDGNIESIEYSIMDEMEIEEVKYSPGHAYSFRLLYLMKKGYTDYEFLYESYADGTTDITDIDVEASYYKPV